MATIDIQELSPSVAEAVKRALERGEEVFITKDKDKYFAKVILVDSEPDSPTQPVQGRGLFGTMKGLVTYMADDFNEPLDDFKDYMPDLDSEEQ